MSSSLSTTPPEQSPQPPDEQSSSSCAVVVSPHHPLGGLPPEIWEKILLDYLANHPRTLFNCYKTCTTFRKILNPEKTQFLFQLVAPFLKTKYLPPEDLLICRRICKKWCTAINSLFSSPSIPLSRSPSIHSGLPPYTWYTSTIGAIFTSSSSVSSFLKSLSKPNDNSLFHSTIKIISRSISDNPPNNRLFHSLRRLCSSPLSYPKITSLVYIASGGRPESDRQILTIFTSFPNLTSVAILKNSLPPHDLAIQNGLNWLHRKKTLFPPLPSLTSINIYLDDAPLLADLILLSYSHQLTSFHCDFRVISQCPFFGQGPSPQFAFHNLQDLDIFDAFGSSTYLERLLKFDLPYLQRLSLEYVEVGPRLQAFQVISQLIDKFSSSLREIRLPQKLFNWQGHGIHKEDSNKLKITSEKVKLNGVKRLGVNMELMNCTVRKWFLGKFTSLETLWITNYGVTYGRGNFLEKDLKGKLSGCWELCPSLRKVTVDRAYLEDVVFYRERSSE